MIRHEDDSRVFARTRFPPKNPTRASKSTTLAPRALSTCVLDVPVGRKYYIRS